VGRCAADELSGRSRRYYLVEDFAASSYASWSEMAKQILIEEETHSDFGASFLAGQIEKLGLQVPRLRRNRYPFF